jgi:hypothetical protein
MTISDLMRDAEKQRSFSKVTTVGELFKNDAAAEETPKQIIERCDQTIAECKTKIEALNSTPFHAMTASDRTRFRELHDQWSIAIEQRAEAQKQMQREEAVANAKNLRKSQPHALAQAIRDRDRLRSDMNQVLSGAVKLGESDRRRLALAVAKAEDVVRACEL